MTKKNYKESPKTQRRGVEKRISVRCKNCGIEMLVWPSRDSRKYCSFKCRNEAMKGNYCGPRGPDKHNWKGGRKKDTHGYVLLRVNYLSEEEQKLAEKMPTHGGYIKEHRIKMAKKIGRPLKSDEVVHHKNGIPDDNRIENLELLKTGTHAKGNLEDFEMLTCPECGYCSEKAEFISH